MSGPPPENLLDWTKAQLTREVQRLRAIMREHAEQVADKPHSGGDLADVVGDPYARGGVVLDIRDAVLMDTMNVVLVDTKRDAAPAMMLLLEGRVNYQTRRTKQAYLFGPDGAAALTTELVGLAARAGGPFAEEFRLLFDERMGELP